jgi:hypothetical protein
MDHSVFWVCPILSFILTAFFCGLAMLSRDKEKPGEIPLPMGFLALAFVVLFHVWDFYNRDSLNSIFHGGSQHMGYYQALWEYGTKLELGFNFVLLAFKALFFIMALLIFVGIVDPPDGKS